MCSHTDNTGPHVATPPTLAASHNHVLPPVLPPPLKAGQYACRFLDLGGHGFRMSALHALRGRLAARRGDRAAAVECWRQAGAIAMEERFHLYALQVGWQCCGEEGRLIAEAACVAMGRSMQVVLRELEAVGATFEGGEAANAAARDWAKLARAGPRGPGALSPRRKLQEAKQLAGSCGHFPLARNVPESPGTPRYSFHASSIMVGRFWCVFSCTCPVSASFRRRAAHI